ncbi:hypothetical protein OUZ56_003624 [Daphnia magna]|uniref:Uncharacterized protein n=1 Tax=Daphnia magna TaxID=35525 RepID=A0ABR0A9N1_9CRUS|nr:hypothetical protein OUZ56_003624 [Daphnia magna]
METPGEKNQQAEMNPELNCHPTISNSCHKTKPKFNKKGEIELLTITNNSGYNAKRHIRTIHPTHLTEFNSAWQIRNQEPSEERQSSNPVQARLSTTRKVKKANKPSIKNHLDSSWKYKQIRTQEDLDKAILMSFSLH